MTRQEQNKLLLDALQEQLGDLDTVENVIADTYSAWVRGLIKQGQQALSPQPVAQQPQGGQPQHARNAAGPQERPARQIVNQQPPQGGNV